MTYKTHGEWVSEMTGQIGQAVTWQEEALALVEHDDDLMPFLVLEILGKNGQYETVFDMLLYHLGMPDRFHMPPIVRLSKRGHPVAVDASTSRVSLGNRPRKAPHDGQPEQLGE